MKKTFNNFRTLAALLMAGAAFAACSSDDNIIENQQPATSGEQVYTLTINASKGDGTTRALDLDGTGKLTASWTNGDELTVVNQTKSNTALGGTLTASNASGNTAAFSGALTGTIEVGDKLVLYYHEINGVSSFSNQDGTLKGTNGAEKYDEAWAVVTVASVNAGKITIVEPYADFLTVVAMLKLTLQDGSSNLLNATSLTISVDGLGDLLTLSPTADTYAANGDGILYLAMPTVMALNNDPALATATVTFTATVGGNTYTTTKTGYKFADGKYYAATLTMVPSLPAGALAGKFTIDAGGTQVYFSQGNLQATTTDGSSWSWAFAENQWDYIGNAAANTSINGNGTVSGSGTRTVDLFGWVGASSTWTGAAQYGISNSTATNNTNGYGNVATEALKSDWGNTIGSGWRTLTSAEWTYLFNTRASGSTVNSTANARYTHATINTDGTSVNGMILFPDGVTIANGEATSWGTINDNSEWGTNCTTAQWSALAAKGCVFLPAAGNRNASSVSNAGSRGFYWSSSPNTSNVSSAVNNAYYMFFRSSNLNTAGTFNRYYGYSVRLVRQVE